MKTYQEKCQERLKKMLDQTIHVNQSFEVLMQVREAQQFKNEIINLSPAFYTTVIRNFIQTLFIEINKMFDPDLKSEGIRSLLLSIKCNIHQIKKEGPIDCDEFDKLTAESPKNVRYESVERLVSDSLDKIDNHLEQLKNLQKQRDKYYAHYDKDVNLTEFFEKNKVSLADLEKLLILNINLCNAVNVVLNSEIMYPVAPYNYDDFKNTLFYVERGLKQSNSKIQNKRGYQ